MRIPMIFVIILSLISALIAAGYDPATRKIMPFVASARVCADCHSSSDAPDDTIRACDPLCITCHKKIIKRHHRVGQRLSGHQSGELRLTTRGRIACITCHDLSLKRFDRSPWTSESLFDRVFRSKKKYRTYFLPIKNTNGELCKTCH